MSTEEQVAAGAAPAGGGSGRMAGKVVIITGASSGIGRSAMELCGREGARVVGTARTESKLQEGLDAVKSGGVEGMIIPADLEDTSSQERIVQATIDEYGQVAAAQLVERVRGIVRPHHRDMAIPQQPLRVVALACRTAEINNGGHRPRPPAGRLAGVK